MHIENRIKSFILLGELLRNENLPQILTQAVVKSSEQNAWFTTQNSMYALQSIGYSLQENKIHEWLSKYDLEKISNQKPKKVAVIMAGNIPLVGFFDFLCVLITGNQVLVKLSSNDAYLLPAIAAVLCEIEPDFADYIEFTTDTIKSFDAVIATGSNNTGRYFEYYFGKYPHIIRQNRNSVSVLTGNETFDELEHLSNDMFLYFGLGCRSVSKLFVPRNYDFSLLVKTAQKHSHLSDTYKYHNNYTYRKTIYLMNNDSFIDGDFFILKEEDSSASPISVVYFEYYDDIETIRKKLQFDSEKIQCVVSNISIVDRTIALGSAQHPELWDYADNVDTVDFNINIIE